MRIKFFIAALFLFYAVQTFAKEITVSARLGYSPAIGGSMSSGWQSDPANLGAADGINSINRSMDGFAVSGVEAPVGIIAGVDAGVLWDLVYFKAGIEYIYQISGGTGKTLNYAGTEIVEVAYSQWSFDAPLTVGIALSFWGESRIYLGGGMGFAYGTYSSSFSSATLDHSASFAGYAIPLVAEAGCEYLLNEQVSVGCGIMYLYGKSKVIDDGADYARVDFSGFHITASAALHFDI